MEQQTLFSDKARHRLGLLISFLIPVIILTGIFIGNQVYPFGDNIYLRSDMYHQYAPFYKELCRKLTEGGDMTFSWNIGMGVNFTAIYAYYLASPINLLLGLLAPSGNVLLIMDIFIILKTGLCGLTCGYYLHKKFGHKSVSYAAVSVFYALSSYMAAFSWNIMWLDCLVLLPLIILGLEKCVKENKYIFYAIMLGISTFSNYYITIMICIYLVMYFIYSMVVYDGPRDRKFYLSRIWSFTKGSLLGGGIGACMFLPELAALTYTASGEFNFPETLTNYFSILNMLSRSLMDVEVSIFNAHEPNLYCTVAVFMFVPLYFFSKHIKLKEKIGNAVLIAVMLLCFNLNIPNYIFHGFHFPNSLPARESFLYIFLLVTLIYQVVIHIEDYTNKQVMGCYAGGIGVMLLIEELYVSESYSFKIVYLSMLFLTFYMFVSLAMRNKKINSTFALYLFFVVCISEATINSGNEHSYKVTGYSDYINDDKAIENILNDANDSSFYRVEKQNRKTKNDAAWNDYKGVSIFSSTANAGFTELLGKLGFEQSTNAYSYYGSTPFTSALLSVKYLITNAPVSDPYLMDLVSYDETTPAYSRYLYKLYYNLPIGFMVPEYFMDRFNYHGNNPFAVQNSFSREATGIDNIFENIGAISLGNNVTINPEKNVDLYIYATTYADNISYTITNENNEVVRSGSKDGTNHRQIIHIGNVRANETVNVTTTDSSVSSLQLYAYCFNNELCRASINSLLDCGLTVSSYDDTHIKGVINAKENGYMYTSIIYDKGWSVYVDGEKTDYTYIGDKALIAVPVSRGTHTVVFEYEPENLRIGLIISASCVLIIILVAIINLIKKKIEKKKNSQADDADSTDNAVKEISDKDKESKKKKTKEKKLKDKKSKDKKHNKPENSIEKSCNDKPEPFVEKNEPKESNSDEYEQIEFDIEFDMVDEED